MLEKTKLALRITTDAFDSEIKDLIEAGKKDLELCGIIALDDDVLFQQAIITFVKTRFGSPEEYDRLKRSYDEQKAQLKTSQRYKVNING